MGQMPVLEVDGRRVHQSISMARYIAKRVGLAGDNDWESLIIDTAVDTVNDFRLSKYGFFQLCLGHTCFALSLGYDILSNNKRNFYHA